jgi:hypothetical protein
MFKINFMQKRREKKNNLITFILMWRKYKILKNNKCDTSLEWKKY